MYVNVAAQVAQEFREAARWRSLPVPEPRAEADTLQNVALICRTAMRRAYGVRIARPTAR